MHLVDLNNRKSCFSWNISQGDVLSEQLVLEDRQHMVNLLRPYVTVDIGKYARLDELNYKEIAKGIDGNFLNQRVRADVLTGVRFLRFDGNTMNFSVNSSEVDQNNIRYLVSVLFDQWEDIAQDPELTIPERARMLLWVGDIRLHCTCPSFLYWGYQYILSQLDAAIYPEVRFPKIKNPNVRGVVCKHLNRVLRVLPFHNTEIATAISDQFGSEGATAPAPQPAKTEQLNKLNKQLTAAKRGLEIAKKLTDPANRERNINRIYANMRRINTEIQRLSRNV